jgi:heme/copper-type cytochrome/quinol oxidase subunit 2
VSDLPPVRNNGVDSSHNRKVPLWFRILVYFILIVGAIALVVAVVILYFLIRGMTE